MSDHPKTYYFKSGLEDLPKLCKELHKLIGERKIIFLNGNLGAGKTTLVKELSKKYEVIDEVSSPTFSLINEYLGADGEKIYHMDLYRLDHEEELLDIGILEYVDSGNICIIEWPELISNLVEPEMMINILHADEGREFEVFLF